MLQILTIYLLFRFSLNCDISWIDPTVEILQDNGFLVEQFDWELFDINHCKESKSCYMQNADNPYGVIRYHNGIISDPTFHTDPDVGSYMNANKFRISKNQTLAFMGCLPPKMKYFGLTPYLFFRSYDNRTWKSTFASLGDSLNQISLNVTDGKDIWNQQFQAVFSPDQSNADLISQIIKDVGGPAKNIKGFPYQLFDISDSKIHYDELLYQQTKLKFGQSQWDDQFTILTRFAYPENKQEFQEWLKFKPIKIYRITNSKTNEENFKPFPPPTLKPRSQEQLENILKPAFASLIQQASKNPPKGYHLSGKTSNNTFSSYNFFDWGGDCLINEITCLGDNRDTIYNLPSHKLNFPFDESIKKIIMKKIPIPIDTWYSLDDRTIIQVIGVNHEQTYSTLYSNIGIDNLLEQVCVASIDPQEYNNTAEKYLKDTEYAEFQDKLFVHFFAFNCKIIDGPCSEIPSKGYPSIHSKTPFIIIERQYINPQSQIGLSLNQTLSIQALVFRKNIFE